MDCSSSFRSNHRPEHLPAIKSRGRKKVENLRKRARLRVQQFEVMGSRAQGKGEASRGSKATFSKVSERSHAVCRK